MIRNHSLTFEDNAESVANGIDVQERSPASLAKLSLILEQLLMIFELNKEVSVLPPTPPTVPGLALWEAETKLHEITEKKWLLSWGLSLTYLILTGLGLGTMASKCSPSIGNYPLYSNHNNLPDALYSLKSFKCMFVATNHQANEWTI